MKTVLIYSGGMDSTSLLAKLIDEGDHICCLNFHYGSKHNDAERAAAVRICCHYGVSIVEVDLPFIGELFNSALLIEGDDIPEGHYEDPNMKQTVVPGRNAIMLSIATGYAESIDFDRVAYAAHSGDHAIYPDCRKDFLKAISKAMTLGTYKGIKVYAPFLEMDKGDVAKIGHDLGAQLAWTWTCYKGNAEHHCGKCGACVERREAFEKHGIEDLTDYYKEGS